MNIEQLLEELRKTLQVNGVSHTILLHLLERCRIALSEQADLLRRAEMSVENCDMYREREASVPDGYALVPVERIKVALESVQNAMEDAYNNAYPECCGRGQVQCCGYPDPAWSAEDHAIMDALAPAQRELSALLAAVPSAPKADDPVKQMLLEALESLPR